MRTTVRFDNLSCKYFGTQAGIGAYLNSIRKYTKMTAEEEEALFERYKANGDEKAREEIILRNQRFIFSLAKRYARSEDEVNDYVDEGNIGLCTAIDKYESDKGFKFMTYAVWYIRRSMNFYLNDTRNLVNKTNNLKIAKKVDKIKEKMYVSEGRAPSDDEIIEILKESFDTDIKNTSDLYDVAITSINENIDDDVTVEEDVVFTSKTAAHNEYEDAVEDDYGKQMVNTLIKSLSPMELRLVSMQFGLGNGVEMTSEDIAEECGMGIQEVNDIIVNALAKMKAYSVESATCISI